ncbi:MAG: hypothetical protein LQ345_002803 [Seirophora villosa]|nr:MAG: hypothetical protein LQ345_002803 [Seirophora villosa]
MEMMDMASMRAELSPVACRIETLVRASKETDKVDVVAIFESDHIHHGLKKLSSLPVDIVYGAWARLLRSYLRRDTVSFGLLSSSGDESGRGIRDVRNFSGEVDYAQICQYHAISERTWGEWLPDACQDISRRAVEQTPINTAVLVTSDKQVSRLGRVNKYTGSELSECLDVVLQVHSNDWPRRMSLQYRSARIIPPYAQSIARTFQTILAEMALQGGNQLGWIDSVSKEDREQIRYWNARELYSNPGPLHHLIQAAALSKPEAEAICAWDGAMTYGELDAVTSNVARQLVRAGVCLGDLIPFAFEKSRWTVVAVVAILKAGGAFVPLLPTHPKSRLKEIITSVGAKMVVTSERCRELIAELGVRALEVSARTAYGQPDKGTDDVGFPAVGPEDSVFVLFTSGSTGKPKGVVHAHGPISTHAMSHGEAMGYRNARVIQFAAHVFDLSILDMTTTLIFGGCVCIPSEEDRVNNISEVMNRMKVDLAMLTPSFANLLRPDDLTTLKTLICCGECYKEEIVTRWRGKIRLINTYGPAETQFTHLRYVDRDDDTTRPSLTIGPLLPTAICVLVNPDNHDQLVPIGAVGELLVAGTSLARGYLDDELKTRAAFISNPAWSAEMGFQDMVFYKTGDLLRYNVGSFDGQYDWVGRKDTQIKVRGQRIEAGEIEHHLARIPGLAASLVALPTQGCFSAQLVAVVQMETPSAPQVNADSINISLHQIMPMETVRAHLSKALPDYAIPSECLTIERMPLTSSCKVDRKTVESWLASLVSKPLSKGDMEAQIHLSPLDEHECTARAISVAVADMLASRDPQQGLRFQGHDFLLQSSGIDSIQVVSLAMFVRKTYGVKIAMEHFHSSSSTVRHLACLIDRKDELGHDDSGGLDLSEEVEKNTAELLESIRRESTEPEARHVFLTGASGYLGSGILRDLLSRSAVDVYALMRCSSAAEGFNTISSKASKHGWWQPSYASRLHIWPGDLTKPKLGLSDEQLQYFHTESEGQTRIDAIIHNGARVHYSTDYHALKAINLDPTKELLALLSASPKLATFVYVSGGRRLTFTEDEKEHAHGASQTNGYGQSKFVSESIVRKCMGHAAFASKQLHIIQPGYIIGSPNNGMANLTDFIWRLVAGCLEIGAYNADESNHWLFIADVDRVAEAVTQPVFGARSIRYPSGSSTDRIRDGIPFSALWHTLEHDFGFVLHPEPQHEWLSRIETVVLAAGSNHMLFPLLATLEKSAGHVGASKEVPPEYVGTSARALDAVRANARYLIDVGFFPPPKQQAANAEALKASGGDSSSLSGVVSLSTDSSLEDKISLSSTGSLSSASSVQERVGSASGSPSEEHDDESGCGRKETVV